MLDIPRTFQPPSPEEIALRIGNVQEAMLRHGLDWYVCFDPENVYYLTNFKNFVHERPFILLIPASGKLRFVAPKLEIPHITSRKIGDIDLIEYFEFPAPPGGNWFDRLDDVLGSAKRVGVESVCQLQIHQAIRAERVIADIIDDLRMIKSPYEIGRMVYAAGIASKAIQDLLANAGPGRSLSEVIAAAQGLMMGLLLKDNPSLNILATRVSAVFQSPRYTDDPHNFSDLAMKMEAGGPHVSIINAVMDGYGTEVERSFFLGHVPEAAKQPFEAMMAARNLVFDMVQPGVPMSEVDKAANDLLKARGYGENLLHRAGHGMGITGHEAPFLAEGDTRIIAPGMSFTVEPGIYIKGVGGFRHSDTIIVTESGNVRLTSAPDTLEDLTLPL